LISANLFLQFVIGSSFLKHTWSSGALASSVLSAIAYLACVPFSIRDIASWCLLISWALNEAEGSDTKRNTTNRSMAWIFV
jgi:hypothetical protein